MSSTKMPATEQAKTPVEEKIDTTPVPVEVYTLTKKIKYEDDEITELRMNFDDLTGEDIEKVEREWLHNGGGAGVPETSKSYLMYVVARAAGVRIEIIRKMSMKDVSHVTILAQNFLIG